MNELATLSDTQLDAEIEKLKEREIGLQTPSGQKFAISKMRECIGWLESIGYTANGASEDVLAKFWAESLQEQIVNIGYGGIQKAIKQWAEHDTSGYYNMPKIPWIIEECEEIGGDPRAEKGRRVQAEAERQMELDHKADMERMKKEHPEWWEKAEKYDRGCM